MNITNFIDTHFNHFNADSLKRAAQAYKKHIEDGNKMMVTLAGAFSTSQTGTLLAEMIRQNKVHAISTTMANLEEDIFLMVAADHYVKVPNWRSLSTQDDHDLWVKHLNRVTDVCIPEAEAMRVLESALDESWERSDKSGERLFVHEHFYRIIREGSLNSKFQRDPKNSWVIAACEKNLPIFVSGAEDGTTSNMYEGRILLEKLKPTTIKSGFEYMVEAMKWYIEETKKCKMGIFVLGGGIAADSVQCIVPTLLQDFRGEFDVPTWDYLCQIGDSTTSYGSFSGCFLEKITWGKISKEVADKRSFAIESDYTIVAPLIWAYVLNQ